MNNTHLSAPQSDCSLPFHCDWTIALLFDGESLTGDSL